MSGPWESYAAQDDAGPWTKYAKAPPAPSMLNGIVRAAADGVPIIGGLLNKADAATNARAGSATAPPGGTATNPAAMIGPVIIHNSAPIASPSSIPRSNSASISSRSPAPAAC